MQRWHEASNLTRRRLSAALALLVVVGAASTGLQVLLSPGRVLANAVRWQLPFDPWNIDPRFDYGTPYPTYGGQLHLGEDVERRAGTAVTSIAAGTVKATLNSGGYHQWGGLVLIEHFDLDGRAFVSLYGHLDPSKFTVRPGQSVALGQKIGVVGAYEVNGNWNEHLHLAVRRGPYVGTWVWWGFGNSAELAKWEKPSTFVAARIARTDVGRVPASSRDRYETAVGVSAWRFPTSVSASEVLLASGEDWVGALPATPLALARNAPLLLTQRSGLPGSTEKELTRVLAAGGQVTIIGDVGQVSDGVAQRVTALGYRVTRIVGGNPSQLSVAVATQLAPPTTAFIVNDTTFADAVSAGAVAAATQSPIILTPSAFLSDDAAAYLSGYGVTSAVIVGGPFAVSTAVEQSLEQLGLSVDRIAGVDRYDTSQLVAGRYMGTPAAAVLATGQHFPDSLSGATLAAQLGGALLLTEQGRVPASVSGYLQAVAQRVGLGLILGGTAAISSTAELQFARILNEITL